MTTAHGQIKATKVVNATCANPSSSPKKFTYLCSFSRTSRWLFFVFCPQMIVVIYKMVGLGELTPPLQKGNLFIFSLSFILGISASFFFEIFQRVPFYFTFFFFSLELH